MGVALALGGCSGGGDSSSERRDVPRSAPETTTTAAPARIDLSQPIPGGSLHGTPRPPLENTGDDYVAIFESLMANLRWISENPDPTLLSEVLVPGTPGHDERLPAYQFLVDNDYHWADEGYQLLVVEVIDAQSGAASLRVTDRLEFERLVNAEGDQVGDTRQRGEAQTYTALMTVDAKGHWRVADSQRADDQVVDV
jgi:hypothetical protein